MTYNIPLLLSRRAEKIYIDSLFERGEIYINTVEDIRKWDDNVHRTDPDDSIFHRLFMGEAEIEMSDPDDVEESSPPVTFTAQDACIKTDSVEKGNIYCFTGIYLNDLLNKRESFEVETHTFGDQIILIHNPREFLKRVIHALKDAGYKKICHDKVSYYSDTYSGYLGPFKKHNRMKSQREYRIYVENENNSPIKVCVGNISDIAITGPDLGAKITYKDGHVQLIKF